MKIANTIADLRQQIDHDLRIQHPEWVQPNGQCPMCDAYEERLMEPLDSSGERNPTSLSLLFIAPWNKH